MIVLQNFVEKLQGLQTRRMKLATLFLTSPYQRHIPLIHQKYVLYFLPFFVYFIEIISWNWN